MSKAWLCSFERIVSGSDLRQSRDRNEQQRAGAGAGSRSSRQEQEKQEQQAGAGASHPTIGNRQSEIDNRFNSLRNLCVLCASAVFPGLSQTLNEPCDCDVSLHCVS